MEIGKGIIYIVAILFIGFGCGSKDPISKIAGTNSKIWEPVKEISPTGEKEPLNEPAKQSVIRFDRNGTFMVSSPSHTNLGEWKFDDDRNALVLQFGSGAVTESFEVLKLKDEKMRLKTEDGITLVMERLE